MVEVSKYSSNIIRVFVKGGIINPEMFILLLDCLKQNTIPYFSLGSRQDILFKVNAKNLDKVKNDLDNKNIYYEVNKNKYKNISSSVLSNSIEESEKWLNWSVYHEILGSFDFFPNVRINIVDSNQKLTPLFSGNLNFIAAKNDNHWYPYIRLTRLGKKVFPMPYLIHSNEIVSFSKQINNSINEIEKENEINYFYNHINWSKNKVKKPKPFQEFISNESYIPNYEGLNRGSNSAYWLGIYFRKNQHSVNIFQSIVKKCIADREGIFGITCWKSMIIYGISEAKCNSWMKLMGEWGMNLRHSTLDLNWHVPAFDKSAYNLKKEIVNTLDEYDISIQGLSFSIIMNKIVDYIFTNIIIKKVKETNGEQYFDVLYSDRFLLNTQKYNFFARSVHRKNLPLVLVELSYFYFQSLKT